MVSFEMKRRYNEQMAQRRQSFARQTFDPDAIYKRAAAMGRTSRAALTGYYRSTSATRRQAPPSQVRAANVRTGGFLGIEVKFLDAPKSITALTAPTGATGGELDPSSVVVGCLSAPAQGDGPTNRDGKKIMMKSIFINGMISIDQKTGQSTSDIAPSVFLALVLDTQSNGAQLNSEDVFTNQNAAAITATVPQRNMSFVSRFKVLKTWKYQFPTFNMANDTGATGGIVQAGQTMPFEISKKFKDGIPVNFTTALTSADIANVIDNSLHLIGFVNDVTAVPNISYNSRMRFVG